MNSEGEALNTAAVSVTAVETMEVIATVPAERETYFRRVPDADQLRRLPLT